MALTTDVKERKATPIATGFIDYFPDAIAEVAVLSRIGNDQHNPGKPLHWDRSKSGDESEALMRHFIERGTMDTDGVRHSAKVAWRAMALLQKEIEAAEKAAADKLKSEVTMATLRNQMLDAQSLMSQYTSPYGAYGAVARDNLGLGGLNPFRINPC
jgi:hypothetical protein